MGNNWAVILKKNLSYILLHEINNSNLDTITITEVELNRDKKFAKVFFHCNKNITKNTKLLNNLQSTFNYYLSKKLDLHHLPKLTFIYDQGLDRGKHIDEILQNLNRF